MSDAVRIRRDRAEGRATASGLARAALDDSFIAGASPEVQAALLDPAVCRALQRMAGVAEPGVPTPTRITEPRGRRVSVRRALLVEPADMEVDDEPDVYTATIREAR